MTEAPSPANSSSILLVTRNLPPLIGGMEKLNLHIVQQLAQEFDVIVVGPAGCGGFLPSGVRVREVPHKPLWRFLPEALLAAISLARRFGPDCVIAGSGLTAPIAFLSARTCAARVAAYVHGLDLVAPSRIYRWFWLPFLRQIDLCIANSRNTAALAASVGIPRSRISVIHPGVEPALLADTRAAVEFRQEHGLEAKKMLLSVGRMTRRKGLLEFVQQAMPLISEACPDTVLVVIGNEAPDALLGDGMGTCAQIERIGASQKLDVRLLGPCDDSVLASAYQAADLHVFPLREVPGDVEGFGMVAVEAASYGLPTVAFAVGGISDAVEEGRSGWLIPANDYPALAHRVIQIVANGRTNSIREKCREFAQEFSTARFGEQLRKSISCCLFSRNPIHEP